MAGYCDKPLHSTTSRDLTTKLSNYGLLGKATNAPCTLLFEVI